MQGLERLGSQQRFPPRLPPRRLGHRQPQELRDLSKVIDAPEPFCLARRRVSADHPREPKRASVKSTVGQGEEQLLSCRGGGLEDYG